MLIGRQSHRALCSSRNLANLIWTHVPTERKGTPESPLGPDSTLKVIVEKKTMVNLVSISPQSFTPSYLIHLR